MNTSIPFWKQPHIYITLLLMVPIYYVVYQVIGTNGFSETVRVMVVTAIISTALGAVLGFWLGTSQSSLKKDEARAPTPAEPTPKE